MCRIIVDVDSEIGGPRRPPMRNARGQYEANRVLPVLYPFRDFTSERSHARVEILDVRTSPKMLVVLIRHMTARTLFQGLVFTEGPLMPSGS